MLIKKLFQFLLVGLACVSTGPSQGLKIRGGGVACCTEVGIICPLFGQKLERGGGG